MGLGLDCRILLMLLAATIASIDHATSAPGTSLRAWIGVEIASVPRRDEQHLGRGAGAYVVAVQDDSPAVSAGLRVGDVVVAVDGWKVSVAEDLICAVMARAPGDEMFLGITREQEAILVRIVLGQQPHGMVLATARCDMMPVAGRPFTGPRA
ncbi:MAG TPA: PDZ domain-containing protein [Hyphomicrobiaceae bacterium]|nr:PDZ domain-containing protein [Hyphomicrobiaceae bacterium]